MDNDMKGEGNRVKEIV